LQRARETFNFAVAKFFDVWDFCFLLRVVADAIRPRLTFSLRVFTLFNSLFFSLLLDDLASLCIFIHWIRPLFGFGKKWYDVVK